jgi:hypothetical protein
VGDHLAEGAAGINQLADEFVQLVSVGRLWRGLFAHITQRRRRRAFARQSAAPRRFQRFGTDSAHSWRSCVLIRYSVLPDDARMATLKMKVRAEAKMRQLLEEEGLPPPDEVEYGFGCIRLFWNQSKTVIVIDIDDFDEVDEELGLPPAA